MLDFLAAPPLRLDPTDAILLLSIIQANIGPVSMNPRLQARYARIEDPPPTHLYRPVSILAVADALQLPFETARRRIHKIAAAGLCELGRAGCRVSPALVAGAGYAAVATRSWSMLDPLCDGLTAAGLAPRFKAVGPHPLAGRSPTRLVSRTLGDYILRTVATAAPRDGDLVDRLIVMCVHALSTTMGLRPKMTSALVARSIGSNPETARRRLEALRSVRILDRGANGDWRTGDEVQAALGVAAADHVVSARRCLATLERAGVLRRAADRAGHPPRSA